MLRLPIMPREIAGALLIGGALVAMIAILAA